MKKLFFLLISVLLTVYLPAQTVVVLQENFESTSVSLTSTADSAGFSIPNFQPWAASSYLYKSGVKADSNILQPGKTIYLTSNSFSTIGKTFVILEFAQICKLYYTDGGVVQVSIDGGTTWTSLLPSQYLGSGTLILNAPDYKFSESAYPTWNSGDTLTKPNNNWWKNETFNLSTIAANQANVKIRFKYTSSGNPLGLGRYGWLLDDVKVTAANNEIFPPRITFVAPVHKDSVYITGPISISAWVKDSSALGNVNLIYSVNGGSNITLAMTNVSDSLYRSDLGIFPYNTVICYSIQASDIYNNIATLPVAACQQFIITKGIPTIQVGTGVSSGTTTPIYTATTAGPYYSYYATILTKSQVVSGGTIESLAFNKLDANGYSLNNGVMRIYAKTVADSIAPTTWAAYSAAKASATKIYESTTQNINTSAGWQTFSCNTGLPFQYSGSDHILLFVEFYRPGAMTGTAAFQYTTVSNQASIFYGTAAVPTTINIAGLKANVKINFETSIQAIDTKVSSFTNPIGSSTVIANTSIPVSVKIKNLGTTAITSANIGWSVDGVYQTTAPWSVTTGLLQDYISTTSINLGNYSFPLGPHTIKAWTNMPNNLVDQNPANDTLTINIYSCQNLNGIITVGDVTADFPTFASLFTALGNCGVNGPLTIKVKSGTYNQQLTIPYIANVSAINTISFQSESGIQSDVIFTYAATGTADNWVLKFDGCQYIKVKNMTFKSTSTTYGWIALLANAASYNTIEGCRLEMPTTTTTTFVGVYNASTYNENYNTIKNNTIVNGYYGMYLYGNANTTNALKENGNVIEGNTLSGFYYYGIFTYNQDSLTIKSNSITSTSASYGYCLYSYYNSNFNILKNKIVSSAAYTYALYINYSNSATGTGLVANNMVSQSTGTSTCYGLYLYSSNNVNVYNNSVNVTGVYTSNYAFYVYAGSNNNIVNNIFSNTGGGYAYYGSSTTGINISNYNDLYASGTNLAYWGGAKTNLAALQAASAKDLNSLSINPQFTTWNNLHINNSYLFNLAAKGTSLPQITDDIDGDPRASIPFIGADEFPFPQNDAGLVAITQPPTMLPTLTQDVKVTIQNIGQLPLTSVTIKCLVNGVLLPSATYSNTIGLAQFGVDSLVIASAYTFPAGYSQIKVYTQSPNNVPDTYNGNDTLYKSVYACTGTLSGTYTIGGVGATYPSVDAAIVSLQCGISGPVVFNINPGTYTGNYILPNATGASASNTITFQSANNDSTSVILQYNAAGTADNFLLNFNNVSNYIFKGLTIKALNATNANIITLAGTLSNISIQNCILEGTQTTSTDDNQTLIRCSTLAQINGFNLIANRMNYGRMAINFASTTASTNVVMKYNNMYNQSARPMNLNRILALDFGYNQLFSDASKTGNGGIFLTNLTGQWKFYNNTLINLGGIRVWEGWVNSGIGAGQEALVYNNYLYGNTTSSYVFDGGGTYTYVKFYHNTFVGNNPTGVIVNFNNYYGCNNYVTFKNNILFSNNGTKLFHASAAATSGSPICSSNFANYFFDYNNYYTTGVTLATFNGITCANLAAFKTATAQEAHSVSINPQFTGSTDPHINNYALKGLATPLSEVLTDIDGQIRSTVAPDPGCDELMMYANDAGIASMASANICPGTSAVIVKFKNFGNNVLNTTTINWSVNGIVQTPTYYVGPLALFTDSNINLGNYTFLSMTAYNLKFWTSDPNGTTDGNNANDTLNLANLYTGLAAGAYTVGDVTADFLDLTTAVNFISTNGICGPVVFNIKPGTYTGRYTIPSILGASAINTVTIKSLNNDSTSVVLAATASGTADNWIIKLSGAKYVTLKNLKFTPLSTTYANAILVNNTSKFNTIVGNYLVSTAVASGFEVSLIRIDDYNSSDNVVTSNQTIGGGSGILIRGSSTTARIDRIIISKNIIEGYAQWGVRSEYANSPVIDSNVMASSIAFIEKHGVSLSYNYDTIVVSRNTIYLSNYTNLRGIDMGNCTSSASTKSLLKNNFIILSGATASTNTYGIRLYPATTYCRVLNNSINVVGTNLTDTRGINPAGNSTNVEVINNNVVCNYYPCFYENTVVTYADFNNYYSTTSIYAYNNGTSNLTYASQALLNAATLKDTNTLSMDPQFTSFTDLHVNNISLYAVGKSLSQVSNDIDNQPRATIPCIGADEFTVLANDAKVRALYTLGSLPKTAGAPHIVKAIVKNIGSTPLTNINVTLNITGSNSFTNTKTIVSQLVGGQDTISFDPFSPTAIGLNDVKVSIPTDADTTNNQLSYFQNVTDTVFGYADTSKPVAYVGFGTASGKMYTKYFVNGTKILHSISAYISKDNTIGKQLYAIVLNSNGVAVDSSAIRTITASDTNTWVQFNVLNPPSTSTANSYFYAGIAQIANASTFNPIGSQIENPTRPGAYYSSAINGSGLIQRTNLGRLMINANFGDPTNKDASMINVLSPVSGCGLTANEVVNVVIQNKGLDTIFGGQNVLMAKYGFKVNGNIINVVTKQITDTIFPAATKNVSFSVPVNVFAPTVDSTYHLVAWVELTNDPFASNDSINLDILSKFTPLAPMANNVSIPYGNAAILTAISNDTIFWYHQAIGGTKLAQGNTYTTPLLFANDTLYANAVTKFSAIATLGTGTSTNGTSSYPAPYGNYWWGQKYQILITKAELNAYGSYGGNIKSLAFDVAVTGGAPLQNFEIKMGHTSSSALATGSYATNLTSVYTNALYTDVVGWNTHVFTTPFIWNGVDNIIVETCFNNSAYTTNAQMRYSTTAFNSVAYSYGDNAANCTNGTSTYAIANRPNMKLSIEKDGCESPRTKVVVTVAPPPANEVAMLAFTSPTGPVPANTTTPIKVKVKNSGLLPLTSVKVNFIVNSVLQPQFPWTNTSTPLQHDSTMELTVGSFNLPGGLDTIIAWTSDPNNVTDPYPLNDTAKIYFSTCMSGNYTIGVGKNFPTFTAALNAATMAGVCGNTVFLADSGLYEERLFLNPIPGAGPNARVSFTSASGDSTKVVLHYTLSSAAAWAMKFIGSSYITFSKMTLSVSGSNTWGRIMELGPNANHIEISNCVLEGMQGGTTSNYTLIYMSGAGINYNTIKNNLILNGYQVLYLYGVSGNTNIKNTISNNNIKDFTYYAIYAAYQDSISIIGNNIQNIAGASYAYGLYSYYCNNFSYLKNKININATYNYGMYLYYNNNTYGSGLVANNFVSQSVGTSTTYGIYAYYSNNVNYYYNSINITGAYTSNYAFYIYGATAANNNIVNNIFSNTGGGYAYYASSTTGVNISNYNDLYATGTNLGYWGGAATSLAAFKSLSGKDANSISVNPGFFSLTNLHMVNFMIDKMGTPIAGVTDDIDGDVRNATLPDMGADEFNLPDNDAGITAMTLPVNPTTTGVQDVKVLLKDWGVLNLTTVTIQWSVNGVMQLPKLWTGNKLSGEVDTVLLGTYNFTAGQSAMKFWTSMPNNVADQLNINDTLLTSVLVCNGALSGSYTLGGSSANYATFNGALQALQMCGIAGPVTFNVAPGFYNEQFVIGNLTGVSASNTVTFKSANGDSTSVVLGFNFTQTNNNYVIQFGAGAQYITIKGMTIRQTNTASGRVINFTGSPSNITIANNRIEMPFNSAGTTAGVVTLSSDFGNDNKILNNNISTGYNGIVAQGSAATPALRTLIKGNIITGFYNYGIQCTYLNSPIIDSNTVVSTVSGSGTRVGIYMSSVTDSMKVSKNTIVLSNSTNTYGIQLETVTGTPISKGLLANNFVSILNGTTYTYALRLYPAINYVVIANNSIYVNGTSTTDTRGINVVAGSNIEVYNNNVVSKYFPTLYEGNLTPILGSNYNNFYSLSSTYAYFNNVSTLTYNSLAALNAVIHMDTNSVSVDPDFISTTNLHVYTSAVNNLAKPLPYVTDDIDGHPRNATTPDIGADEFSPLPVDLAVTAFIEPSNFYAQAGATIPIKVKIKNYGADSVANFNVVCKIGNATPIVQLYTNYFHSNQLDSVLFTSITVPSGAFEIKVYTSDANDGNHLNDTLKMNYFGVPIKNIPYAENFDNTVQEWFSPESTSLWEHGIPIASVINTAHSAPNVWATKLNGNYTNSNISTLYSPIFNIAVFRADTLKFWHWVDAEINKDGGHIEYLDNMGNWDVLGHITPADTNAANWYNGSILNMWTGYSAGWYESKYKVSNLTNLGSTVQFRFVFASDATNSSYNGWAIDDFALTLAPIPADAGVIAITSPAATSLVGDLVTVSVTVKNFGTDTLTNIPVKYQVGSLAVVSGILAGPLAPLATSNYTFSQQVQVANINYTICAFTTVVGDIYTQNDISCKNIIVNPAPNDVAVTEILQPGANVSGSTTLIKVVIKNFGTLTQTSIPVTYQRGALTPVNAIWTGSLAFGDTVQFTFPSPMNIPSGVSFSLCGFTKLVNDAYIHNDSSCKSVVICTVAQAGIISGPTSVGSGATGVAYSVPTILNATTYVWTYTPSTGVVIHGNGTSSITIDFGVGSLNGVLSVYGQSSVCSGSPSSINIATNVGINDIDGSNFWLGQNTPNPTTGLTNIEYNLPLAGEVKFDIVNLYGQKVYTSDEKVEAGTHRIDLNVNDLAAGVYYYTIEFKGKRLVKKMVVNK